MANGAPPNPAPDVTAISRVLTGRMPDLSPAQLVAIVGAVIAVAVSFGANISREQQEAILALAAAVGAVLFAADAHIRSNRAHAEAAKHAADQHGANVQAVLDHHSDVVTQALASGQPPPPLVYPPPPTPPPRR